MKNLKRFLLFFLVCVSTDIYATVIPVKNLLDNGSGSLRWACNQAVSGDTVLIDVKGTINLNEPIIIDNQSNITILGPYPKHNSIVASNTWTGGNSLFQILNSTGIEMRAMSFRNGNADVRAIEIGSGTGSAGNSILVYECLFDSLINVNLFGGAIEVNGQEVEIYNSGFINNAGDNGAAIAVNGSGNVKINNCTFFQNIAQDQGGAVYIDGTGITRLVNNTFKDNDCGSNLGEVCFAGTNTTVVVQNNAGAGNGTGTQFFPFGGGSPYTSNGGNKILLNGGTDGMSWTANGTDQYDFLVNPGLRTQLLEDGFGLKYFTIVSPLSSYIDIGANGGLLPTDGRRAPRILFGGVAAGFPDAGACEYTPLRVTDPSGFNVANSLGNAFTVNNDAVNYIEFDINGSGPHVINPSNQFNLNAAYIIDAFTQPNSAIPGPPPPATPGVTPPDIRIEIEQSAPVNIGLNVNASGSVGTVIQGIRIVGFSEYGISLNASQSKVYGCEIGFRSNLSPLPNDFSGIYVTSDQNQIGGIFHFQRNTISGNGGGSLNSNIYIIDGVNENRIRGNIIGIAPNGQNGLSNSVPASSAGIVDQAINTIIGGSGIHEGNVICASPLHGIRLDQSSGTQIIRNHIGVGYDGTTNLPNGIGILLENGAAGVIIGGTNGHKTRNIISGNNNFDIGLFAATSVQIIGNYIGVDSTGINPVNFNQAGIVLNESSISDVQIGSTLAESGNIISSHQIGINIPLTGGNVVIQNNYIGTDATGDAALANTNGIILGGNAGTTLIGGMNGGNLISGNTDRGVFINGASGQTVQSNIIGLNKSDNGILPNNQGVEINAGSVNTIGGNNGSGFGNVISGNGSNGVFVNNGANQNNIQGNIIGLNNAQTLDFQNTINGIKIENATSTLIGGTAGFENVVSGHSDPGSTGIFCELTGSTDVQSNFIGTDFSGTVAFGNETGIRITDNHNATIGGSPDPTYVCASLDKGIHILSPNVIVDGVSVGVGVSESTASLGNEVGIEIQAQTVQVGTAAGPINTIANNNTHGIYLNGDIADNCIIGNCNIGILPSGNPAGNGGNGITIQDGDDNEIGFELTKIGASVGVGISIQGNAQSNEVHTCFIGNVGGVAGTENDMGIAISGGSNNTIGSLIAGEENIIGSNTNYGIDLSGTTNNFIVGNYIGLDAAGNALPNSAGINMFQSDGNIIGVDLWGAGKENIISHNVYQGIQIIDSEDNLIAGNKIGTTPDGLSIAPNSVGVYLGGNNCKNNQIGGDISFGLTNVISGNVEHGVAIECDSNFVYGNLIGVNGVNGLALNNQTYGIGLFGGAEGNVIGGTRGVLGNMIAGNISAGIILDSAANNLVEGNLIGAVSNNNQQNGIILTNTGAESNIIGDYPPQLLGNFIYQNINSGILTEDGAHDNLITNNIIGLDTNNAESTVIQQIHGIEVSPTSGVNDIGFDGPGIKNVISGNQTGIFLDGCTGQTVFHNFIGTDTTGLQARPNTLQGVLITNGASSNQIGGAATFQSNLISGNSIGVHIESAASTNNIISGNKIGLNITSTDSIANNIGVGIDSGANNNHVGQAGTGLGNLISGNQVGVAIDGAHDNLVQNNEIGSDLSNEFGILIQNGASNNLIGGIAGEGNLISGNDTTGIAIFASTQNEVFGNYIGVKDDGISAQGNLIGIYLNTATDNQIGDATPDHENIISANSIAGIVLESNSNVNRIQNNLIGTDFTGLDTAGGLGNGIGILISESNNNLVGGNWDNDEGNVICGNLEEGIYLWNATGDTIVGNNIGLSKDNNIYLGNLKDGVYLENNSNGNFIGKPGDGFENVITSNFIGIHTKYSTGNFIQNNYVGNDDTGGQSSPSGNNVQAIGVALDTGSVANTVNESNVLSGNQLAGIGINGTGSNFNTVQGNLIGVDIDGNDAYSNDSTNVLISGGAKFNLIGGGGSTQKNIIGGDATVQVYILNVNTDTNQIAGNNIGLGIDNSTTYNSDFGVAIADNAVYNIIGGSNPGEGNHITEFAQDGILILNAQQTRIFGNRIGIKPNGDPAPIDSSGIALMNADNSWVGAVDAYSDSINVITNCRRGVEINYGTEFLFNNTYGAVVGGNSIYNNLFQGIDINGDDVLLVNDTSNNDGSLNNGHIDRPEIVAAWNCDGVTKIGFKYYASNTLNPYHLQVYTNADPDPSGYGEGQFYIGNYDFGAGTPYDTIAINLDTLLAEGTIITATLTGFLGNTSEFSKQDTITVAQSFSVNPVPETCLGAGDGQIEIDAPEGYYFSIDNFTTESYGDQGDTLFVAPGPYVVEVEYLNGCILNQTISVPAGTPLPVDINTMPDTCGYGLGSIAFDTTITGLSGGTGDYVYSYDQGFTFSGTDSVSNLSSGTYYLQLEDTTLGCFSEVDTVIIEVVEDLVDESFEYDDFCTGDSPLPYNVVTPGGTWFLISGAATMNPTTGGLTGTTEGQSYTVVYQVGQCLEEDTIVVTHAFPDTATFNYSDFCIGTTPSISTTMPNGVWSLVGSSGGSIDTDGIITGPPGSYDVIYTTTGTCPEEDTNTVLLYAQPAGTGINTTETLYCDLDSIHTLSTSGDGAFNYSWYDDAGLTNVVGTGTQFTPTSIGVGDNYFFLNYVDTAGCVSDADSINLFGVDLSGMYAGPDQDVCIGSVIQLEANGGISYNWTSSDQLQDDTTEQFPQARILIAEAFFVNITDQYGCSVMDTTVITLLPSSQCNVDTYNAFSPNGDGTNDFWIIDGIEGFPENTVTIFNRWGDKLRSFENYDNVNVVWDGLSKSGKVVPMGTYFYVVEVGGNQNQAGWVQVMR